MPPLIPSLWLLRWLYISTLSETFIWRSCLYRKHQSLTRLSPNVQRASRAPGYLKLLRQYTTSIAPVISVNATKEIPAAFRELHEKLGELEKKAATYVNLSQLQLALRGLESEDAVLRVAVLGVNNRREVGRLARALIADPLGPEQQWERVLGDDVLDDGRSLLIRYGEDFEYDLRHPLLRTLSTPSALLRKSKIEILLNSNIGGRSDATKPDFAIQDLLVPTLEIPNSASGRVSMITYPVHKVIVHGQDVPGLLAISQILGRATSREIAMMHGVIGWSWKTKPGLKQQYTHEDLKPSLPIDLIDTGQALTAIEELRLNNPTLYEKHWLDSKIAEVLTWLLDGTTNRGQTLKPAISRLIANVIASAELSINSDEAAQMDKISATRVPDIVRQSLTSALDLWAEEAHLELREKLNLAFNGILWRRLAWWKLVWRVDDVEATTSDVLQRFWLVDAEKEMIFITGRLGQAGLLDMNMKGVASGSFNQSKKSQALPRLGDKPQHARTRDLISSKQRSIEEGDVSLYSDSHWPRHIALARSALITLSIPPLQALAERLLLQTISTTFLTSALSVLMYLSISTTSLYEAAVIGIAGFVWSIRRLQRYWEAARLTWVDLVREEGRKVLGSVEGMWRKAVRDGGASRDDTTKENREKAREVVGRARTVLKGME